MKPKTGKTKGTKTKAKKPALRDLEPSKADATKGGTTNSSRSDPYKNFKFRP